MRIDAAFRVDETTRLLKFSGGARSLTDALYMTAAALAAEMQTQGQAILGGGFTCTESAGVFTMANAGPNFSITWTHPALRDWLGWTADLSGANSYTAPNTCAGTFVPTRAWEDQGPSWTWQLRSWTGHHQTGGSLKTGREDRWRLNARVQYSELAQLRSVMSYLLNGMPATWFRNSLDTAAFDYDTNWDGTIQVLLDQSDYSDEWIGDGDALIDAVVPLTLLEWAA
ncbi:hypothetical protein CMI37_09510 [Candidatus Pacearchaeota archaeon]|nr:hypothetical protein [Candidatus Pacearchaeota archaeon]